MKLYSPVCIDNNKKKWRCIPLEYSFFVCYCLYTQGNTASFVFYSQYTLGNTASIVCYFPCTRLYSFICLLLSMNPGEYSFICLLLSIHPGKYSSICLLLSIHPQSKKLGNWNHRTVEPVIYWSEQNFTGPTKKSEKRDQMEPFWP
jgi:hypothetical protein